MANHSHTPQRVLRVGESARSRPDLRAGHSSPLPGKLVPTARPARPGPDSHTERAYKFGDWVCDQSVGKLHCVSLLGPDAQDVGCAHGKGTAHSTRAYDGGEWVCHQPGRRLHRVSLLGQHVQGVGCAHGSMSEYPVCEWSAHCMYFSS